MLECRLTMLLSCTEAVVDCVTYTTFTSNKVGEYRFMVCLRHDTYTFGGNSIDISLDLCDLSILIYAYYKGMVKY